MNKKWVIVSKGLVVAWFIVATLIAISAIKERMPNEIWRDSWEFVKIIVGPALGVGFAFYVNDYVHKERKKNDERTVIYGASYAIGSMLEDFLNVKLVIREMLGGAAERFADDGITDAPLVAYARPQVVTFVEDNGIDLASLHFLLHLPEGKEAFQHLQHLERIYKHLITTHGYMNEALLERQTKMAAASDDELRDKSEVEIIGLKTYIAATDFLLAVVEHAQKDEQVYIDATNKLAAAADVYLNEITPLKHRGYHNPHSLDANMKPLPPPFVAALKYGDL